MKESDIRNREIHNRYLEMVKADAELLFADKSKFLRIPCPACGSQECPPQFERSGFTYVQCSECDTLFTNPRPDYSGISDFYVQSASTKYWVTEFFMPMAEARREKIFKPRAEYIAGRFPELRTGRTADIGSGFGLFLVELRKIWPQADLRAIEPSVDMASIIRNHGFPVIESMVEDVDPGDVSFDLLTSFELFEHLHEPERFLTKTARLLNPGGFLYFTTLNGLGFDIQVFWERSKSVSPPHHLNFFNPHSIRLLLERNGFEVIEAVTPGELDWDIVEGAWKNEAMEPGRFFRTVSRYGSDDSKKALQSWLRTSGFSSHMRVVARKKAHA